MKPDWERLRGESSKAYEHFCIYRDLGVHRSLREVMEDGKCAVKLRQLEYWSSRWEWVRRASLYDDYIERKKRAKNEKELAQMAERHAKVSVVGQNIVIQKLNEWMANIPAMTFDRAVAALRTLVEVERIARGQPIQIQATEHSGPGGGPIRLDLRKMTKEERREEAVRCWKEMGWTREEAEVLADAMLCGDARQVIQEAIAKRESQKGKGPSEP